MNIPPLPTLTALGKTLIAATFLAGLTGPANFATASEAAANRPQFTAQQSTKRVVNKGYRAYAEGNFSKSAAYSRYALQQGLKTSHKTIVYSNLCAALGIQGRYADAIEACNTALELAPGNWQAYSNRAAANWLSGDKQQARQDIKSAREIDGQAPEITYNAKVFG